YIHPTVGPPFASEKPQNQIGWSHCTSNLTIRQVTATVPVVTSKPDLPKWNNHSYVVVLAYSLLTHLSGTALMPPSRYRPRIVFIDLRISNRLAICGNGREILPTVSFIR